MRIGIEAQRLFRKKKHGMDIVALELIKGLQKLDDQNNYFIFVKQGEDENCIPPKSNFNVVKIKNAPYPYWEQVRLPKVIKDYNLDLLHCTSNTAPIKISIPLVITIHDIIYLERLNLTKGSWYQILGNLYRRWNVPIVAKFARHIITVSAYEKTIINNYFQFNQEKIITIYNGVGEAFKKIVTEKVLTEVRERYKLPQDYMFFLGNTDPKKNLAGVLKALSILIKSKRAVPTLVMLDIDRHYLRKIIKETEHPEIEKHIVISGYVPNHELPAIYSMATLFLYPSIRESFGIPILEAMACGAPVITSNTSSMPEISGNAAVLIDPLKPIEIADAIFRLHSDKVLREKLILKGFEQVKKFQWVENASKTQALYSTLINE